MREKWHKNQVIENNLGAKNTEKLIDFCYPEIDVKCGYSPKNDVAAIKLKEKFEKINARCKFYENYQEFLNQLKIFIPYEKIEEIGIYTNFIYRRDIYSDSLNYINDRTK